MEEIEITPAMIETGIDALGFVGDIDAEIAGNAKALPLTYPGGRRRKRWNRQSYCRRLFQCLLRKAASSPVVSVVG
jgi:hypothetical protein